MSERFGLENSIIRGTNMHDAMMYCYNDVKTTYDCFKFVNLDVKNMTIKKVIFNDPATIVYWGNGERTVIKCSEDDSFDQEKGLAMAICKRALGADYKKVFKEWIPEEKEEEIKPISVKECIEAINRVLNTPMSFTFGIDKTEKESETTVKLKYPEGLAIRKIDE